MSYRDKIEAEKAAIREMLTKHSSILRRRIIREVEAIRKKHPEASLEDMIKAVRKEFRLPAYEKNFIEAEIRAHQKRIAAIWDSPQSPIPFGRATDFERILAAYKVDFHDIEEQHRDAVIGAFRAAIRNDWDYERFRKDVLSHRDLGMAQARTLAHTAVRQFDNGYMHAKCEAAGITKFKWDGPNNPNSRPMCQHEGTAPGYYEKPGALKGLPGMLWKTFTWEELRAMSNGQNLPVTTSLGGYNCVHYLTPVVEKAQEQTAPAKRTSRKPAQSQKPKTAGLLNMTETELLTKTGNQYEACAIIKGGQVIFEKSGRNDSIGFNIDEIEQIKGADIFTHNHPRGYAFSLNDIVFAQTWNIKEIRAIAPKSVLGDGVFSWKINPNTSAKAIKKEYAEALDDFRYEYELYYDTTDGSVAKAELWETYYRQHHHKIWEKVAKITGAKFAFERNN